MTPDRAAERSVIGALLLEPDRFADVREWLEPGDVHGTAERQAYEAICAVGAREQELSAAAVDQELRTSNKALADYVTALFGSRLEPWHEEAEIRAAATNADNTSGKGIVAAPEAESDLISKHAPRSTSPIMIAQSIVEPA